MVVELVDICAQIDPAFNELIFYFALNISAREIGDCAGSYLCDKRVIIDIFIPIVGVASMIIVEIEYLYHIICDLASSGLPLSP